MNKKHSSSPQNWGLSFSVKRIFSRALDFLRSPYYNWRIGLIWPMFLGYAYAMFPFEDMSLGYAIRPAVFATAIESMLIIAAIICWIMFVSYTLDRRHDWHNQLSRRLVMQICLGGLIPFSLLLIYLWRIYGLDMMLGDYMHFVYALFLVFLVILNRQGYIVYLLNKVATLKSKLQSKEQELLAAEESVQELMTEQRLAKQMDIGLREQMEFMQLENTGLRMQLEAFRERELVLVADLADRTAQLENKLAAEPKEIYELSYPEKESLFFKQEEIARFYIQDSINKKPIIYLVTNTGEEFLITENSLTGLALRFTEMIHVSRTLLIGAHTLLGLTKLKEGAVELMVDYQDDPITVAVERWKKIEQQVAQALAARSKGI
ncbi:hypothetical protein ORI89_02770 [Sphingobacterium sp. UT-1RO-CII-1]|uniref:hypothetical protein n=1 Tax=Sphingobacterium sp. UT-1RO-CII-1 TaxID=2995225 RepID=UPI00227D5CA7|nr:hypothetical protein [Sphingobacterium sp. UT-1RO-CII-1]MCY4778558.1 hypothetical protein [Sphingobacterium sp. UT-1RO-CII-1]